MSEDQFTKLFKSMQDFRIEVNARFDKTASEDQLKKLFKYTCKHFSDFENKLNEKSSQSSLDRLTNTIDSFVKRLDNSEIEQYSRDLQFERLLSWARNVSKKTGIPLVDL